MRNYPTQLVIRLKPETLEKLRQRAEKESRPPSALARMMIERSLQREKLK